MEAHGNKSEIFAEKFVIHKENVSTWVPSQGTMEKMSSSRISFFLFFGMDWNYKLFILLTKVPPKGFLNSDHIWRALTLSLSDHQEH